MHPLRLLLDRLPVFLVEPGQVRRPGGPAAGLPLHRRHARPGDRGAPRQPRGPVPPVPLPQHYELRRRLPEEPQPDQGDRQNQGNDGQAHRLMEKVAQRRLLWKCRRGLLEIYLVLSKYLQKTPYNEELVEFLDLPDNDLWDIVSGRSDRYEARFGGIVARIRATRVAP